MHALLFHRLGSLKKYAIALLIAALFAGSWLFIGQAQVREFYPSSCLGGWDHPELAKGQPDLGQGASSDEFTYNNAAVLSSRLGQLFCGQFEGNIPPESRLGAVTLHMRWRTKERPEIAPFTIPSSLLFFNEVTFSVVKNGIPSYVYTPRKEWDGAGLAGGDAAMQKGIAEALYTLDGSRWVKVGVLEEEQPNRGMRLPLSDWEDIKTIQINVRQAQVYQGSAAVFLDGMWLEASYEAITTQ